MKIQAVRIVLTAALIGVLAGSMFTGCGAKTDTAAEPEVESLVEEIPETASAESAESTTEEPTAEIPEEELQRQAEADRAQLEAFLQGTEPVYFNKMNVQYYAQGGEENVFAPGLAYTLEDFQTQFYDCKITDAGYAEENIPSMDEMTLSYAWIDCENSGSPALALLMEGVPFGGPEMTDLWVMKPVDGQLEMLYNVEYGYRADATINEYGVIHYGGSGGAAIQADDTYVITKEGDCQLVVAREVDLDAHSFFMPDELVSDEEGLGEVLTKVSDLVITQYHFEPYGSDGTDGNTAYLEYCQNGVYICHRRNDAFDLLEDIAIYDEGTPYREYMDHFDVTFVTPNEGEQLLAAHKEALGFEDAWEEAPEVSFESLRAE